MVSWLNKGITRFILKIFNQFFYIHKKSTSHFLISKECKRNSNISRHVQSQIIVGKRQYVLLFYAIVINLVSVLVVLLKCKIVTYSAQIGKAYADGDFFVSFITTPFLGLP